MGRIYQERKKWETLFRQLAETANEGGETGYDTYPLQDEMSLLAWSTVNVLNEMGVPPPRIFPTKLEPNENDDNWDAIEDNPYSSLVYNIYQSLTDIYGFYIAYIDELIRDNEDLIGTDADNIEPCLIQLAASKIENIDEKFALNFSNFRFKTKKEYTEWINLVKEKSFRAGAPIRAELMELVSHDHGSIGATAEAESLGFNEGRLHPDIYMNELLQGMRVIHQVLPAIMKKLGMDEKDFSLDQSPLHTK